MFTITARFTVKPGHETDFLERVQRQSKDSLEAEAACTRFDVCRSRQDNRIVLLYEIYADEAAFSAHLNTSHFLSFDADTKPWIEDKVVEKWDLA
jgi:(4S)-4-hydroxy-5-phosphonooxypentane-2,3-dione isomerase